MSNAEKSRVVWRDGGDFYERVVKENRRVFFCREHLFNGWCECRGYETSYSVVVVGDEKVL